MGKSRKNIEYLVETWENLSYIEKLDVANSGGFNVNIVGHKNITILRPLIKNRKKILDYGI